MYGSPALMFTILKISSCELAEGSFDQADGRMRTKNFAMMMRMPHQQAIPKAKTELASRLS